MTALIRYKRIQVKYNNKYLVKINGILFSFLTNAKVWQASINKSGFKLTNF